MSVTSWWFGLLVLSFVVQSALSKTLDVGSYIDLPLVIATWIALVRGERMGMIAGSASGWISEALFGFGVRGVSGLVRLFLGFALGFLGSRMLVSGVAVRFAVLLAVTVIDTRAFEWISPAFGVAPTVRPPDAMALRGALNALFGLVLLSLLDRHRTGARDVERGGAGESLGYAFRWRGERTGRGSSGRGALTR